MRAQVLVCVWSALLVATVVACGSDGDAGPEDADAGANVPDGGSSSSSSGDGGGSSSGDGGGSSSGDGGAEAVRTEAPTPMRATPDRSRS